MFSIHAREYGAQSASAQTTANRCDEIALVTNPFDIGNVPVGRGQLFLIAGPCVIESEQHARAMAEAIQLITSDLGMPYIFKASYDKANRTSIKSFRGPGLAEGCRILRTIGQTTGLPVLTAAAQAAIQTGRAINVKKGQFVAPLDMRHAVEKIRESGCQRVSLTERGASFGYNNLVVDMRSLPIMRAFAPVVFDGTHSVQTPSAGNGVSGGQPEFIPVLARAAVAAGIDGIFLEVHDDPPHAKSDGANALHLNHLKAVLEQLLAIHKAAAQQ